MQNKRIYNSISLLIIALLIFFLSAFYNLKSEDNFDFLEETLVQDMLLRSLGFWMFGFILLTVLVVINNVIYKTKSQSYITIFSIGIILNLIFAIIGSLIYYFV